MDKFDLKKYLAEGKLLKENIGPGSAILGGSSPLQQSEFERLVQKEIGEFEGPFNPWDDEEIILKIRDYVAPNSEDNAYDFYMYGMRNKDNGFIRIAKHGEQGYANISPKKDIIRGGFFEESGHLGGGVYIKKGLLS